MKQEYHNQCTKCPDTFWTEDAWKDLCPFCTTKFFFQKPPMLNDPPRTIEWIEKDAKGNITSREIFGGSRYIMGCDPYKEEGLGSTTIMKVTDGIYEMVDQYRKDLDFLEEMARMASGIPDKL